MYHTRVPKLMIYNVEKKSIWNSRDFQNVKWKVVPNLNKDPCCSRKFPG